ncbi:MAG: deoxyribose-phosphate aldolase [Lachnospiraceae bacterium]|jgi:deoxyribose-phosphate aldolase|uniref:deoxyribose-phosphate aldolase n=1 Tax=Candidatus Merdisoma sp. JLR.KK011 TaxID=3114299 RepID=UPI0014338A72|nr:deoxyribose-phosphate aldolase [Lachnospiraceae bacterium]MCI9384634.1 deoxyribose-phosphate aldolase [Lachnospiraceae bacterium]MCI9478483.1 deoxyribose-phosphate aldolase [Lachnospiraceae bacterium]MCI9623244.1 deoxyribose-phosphate aldolase [Lachnospiraceae bacterium]GFI09763.1 deoxyribose-phosphate aldolase [Lachnospiraceae bacterium]
MTHSEILSKVDHTNLSQTATWEDIKSLCDDAVTCRTASVCIPPAFVKRAKEYTGNSMAVCTVIGFPNGYHTTEAKAFETRNALENGADEIDMVIHIGALKEKNEAAVLKEISELKKLCGSRILKVIIETCLLTQEEKITMCRLVTQSGADFIKTSTGFSSAGATFEDVALFAAHVGPGVQIKAAGGISSFEDGERFLTLGASRLGTSRLVKLEKAQA